MRFRFPRWLLLLTGLALVILVAPAVADTIIRGSDQRDAWRDDLVVLTPEEIGRMMAEGKRVVWVDVREPQEYEEFHVPGAVSVPLRDVEEQSPKEFADADLVVPYCLKDFRGYEGARKLQNLGVDNVGLVEGFGINSWKRSEMPVAGADPGMSDQEALQALVRMVGSDQFERDGDASGTTGEGAAGQ